MKPSFKAFLNSIDTSGDTTLRTDEIARAVESEPNLNPNEGETILEMSLPTGTTGLAIRRSSSNYGHLLMVADEGETVLRSIKVPLEMSIFDLARLINSEEDIRTNQESTPVETGPTNEESSHSGLSVGVSDTSKEHHDATAMNTQDTVEMTNESSRTVDSSASSSLSPENLSRSDTSNSDPILHLIFNAFDIERACNSCLLLVKQSKEDKGITYDMELFDIARGDDGRLEIQPGRFANELGVTGCKVLEVPPEVCMRKEETAGTFSEASSTSVKFVKLIKPGAFRAEHKVIDLTNSDDEDNDADARIPASANDARKFDLFASSSEEDSSSEDDTSYIGYLKQPEPVRAPTPPIRRDWWRFYQSSSESSMDSESSWEPESSESQPEPKRMTRAAPHSIGAPIPRVICCNSDLNVGDTLDNGMLLDSDNNNNMSVEDYGLEFCGKRKRENDDENEAGEPPAKRRKIGDYSAPNYWDDPENVRQFALVDLPKLDFWDGFVHMEGPGPVLEAVAASANAEEDKMEAENEEKSEENGVPMEASSNSGNASMDTGSTQDPSPSWISRLRPSVPSRVARMSRSTSESAESMETTDKQLKSVKFSNTTEGENNDTLNYSPTRLIVGGGEHRTTERQSGTRIGGPKSAGDAGLGGDGATEATPPIFVSDTINIRSPSPRPPSPPPESTSIPLSSRPRVDAPTPVATDRKTEISNSAPPNFSVSQSPGPTPTPPAPTHSDTSSTSPTTSPDHISRRRQHYSTENRKDPPKNVAAAAAQSISANKNFDDAQDHESSSSATSDASYPELRTLANDLYRSWKRERKEIEKLCKSTTPRTAGLSFSRSNNRTLFDTYFDDEPAYFKKNDDDETMKLGKYESKMQAEKTKKDGARQAPDGSQATPVEFRRAQRYDSKINDGDDGGGDSSPPSSHASSDESSSNSDSSTASFYNNKNSRRKTTSSFDSDEILSSSSDSAWSNDDNDDNNDHPSNERSSSSLSSSDGSHSSCYFAKHKSDKPKRGDRCHRKRRSGRASRRCKRDRVPSASELAKITHGVMKTLTHMPDNAGKTAFAPTGILDRDSKAFYEFLETLHDAFSRWAPLRNILRDAHRDGSIHRVRREYDEAAYAAMHRLFPSGITNNFMGKHKSVMKALKMMRQKYANGGKDARISRLLTLMKTQMRRDENATDFIERVTSIQRQGIAQKAPIKNRELRDHIMHVLCHSRFYRVETAALEGTASARGKKLTLREIKKHFARIDKKRQQRAQVVELSNGPAGYYDQRRNMRAPNRRTQAWANAADFKPRRPLAPIPNGIPP